MSLYQECIDTPLGELVIQATDTGLCYVGFDLEHKTDTSAGATANSITAQAASQLQEYFRGARAQFELPLDIKGTEFQHQIWQALGSIAYGQTGSYGDIARLVGNPKAVRAVGAANGRNPISIIVPCHRVIGANGTLTGYAGGLERKRWLLALEQTHCSKE
ncbi:MULTISPECIES: methylated-DNA--[protein]-cysteine S-methyltransferase [unclassified Pseudoalteromonas]|uniref:methylated-DNA--[protein]-cysteine S-methyltransferase n=1 Tax=unclassified Pseudoalteromonas TaxID=194690 RepID=UPI000CF6E3FE|nr:MULTISPECIES: methylated-DNA--[protein]-cysteine S-methyltransferase [unclassified Pseudoalteromonas]MBS3797797.1 methylated-DNA--[protein]-cysteine S-methyltransferase [Pseudoalteromonas sp. BDTF-M6]